MGGKILLSILNKDKGKGHINQVRADIAERGIEPPRSTVDIEWKEIINMLRIDKFKRLVELELLGTLSTGS